MEMFRKKRGEFAADFEHLDDAELNAMRQQLARWGEDNFKALRGAQPTMSKDFYNRLRSNWRPLLAIADLAGGKWPTLARNAAVALAPKGTSSIGTTLLEDIRTIAAEKRTDRLASVEIPPRRCTPLKADRGRNGDAPGSRSVPIKLPGS